MKYLYLAPPNTVDEAVARLPDLLPEETLNDLRAMKREDLVLLHFSLGQAIRNEFNLWNNPALLADAGVEDADEASLVILQRFHDELLDSERRE